MYTCRICECCYDHEEEHKGYDRYTRDNQELSYIVCIDCLNKGVYQCKECYEYRLKSDQSILNNICPECLELQVDEMNESLAEHSATLEQVSYDVKRIIAALKNK